MGLIQSLVFRPPRPALYSEYSLLPQLFFTTTRLGIQIPIAVDTGPISMRSLRANPSNQNWILFCHGNAEDLLNATAWTTYVSNVTSMVVVSYDYSGYGLSKKVDRESALEKLNSPITEDSVLLPNEELFYADAEAALEFAEEELGLQREKAILWGRSLGCSACCHLLPLTESAGRSFSGVILQSPFTSVLETVAMTHLQSSYDMFRNYDKIKAMNGIHCPVFVIHGMNDWVINVWHAQEMVSLIMDEFLWPPLFPLNCGHNDLEASCEGFMREIQEFLQFCCWHVSET